MLFAKIFAIFLIVLSLFLILRSLILVIKRNREKEYYSYIPEFENKEVENYYYKVYEVISINSHVSSDRDMHTRIRKIRTIFPILPFLISFILSVFYVLDFEFLNNVVYIILAVAIFAMYLLPKVIHVEVIPKVIKYVNNTLSYFKNSGISSIEYDEAFMHDYDEYIRNDLIQGKLHNYSFSMSEVHTQEKIRVTRHEEYFKTIFHGVIAIVDLNNANINDDIFTTGFYNMYNQFCVVSNDQCIENDIKIINNKLFIKFDTGGIFDTDYSNERDESLSIAQDLYNLELMLKIIEDVIINVTE